MENFYKETYRGLQAVKLLYREAFVVRLKPLVRTKGDPSTLPEDCLIMVKKKIKTVWKALYNGKKYCFLIITREVLTKQGYESKARKVQTDTYLSCPCLS